MARCKQVWAISVNHAHTPGLVGAIHVEAAQPHLTSPGGEVVGVGGDLGGGFGVVWIDGKSRGERRVR